VESNQRDSEILIKVSNLVHLFADLDLEVTSERAVRKSNSRTDSNDIHAAVGSRNSLAEGSKEVDGDTVDGVGSAELSGGSGHTLNSLEEDVGHEAASDLDREVTHVENTGSKGIPVDRGIYRQRRRVDGNLIVEHRLIDALADTFGLSIDLEEVVALDDETSGFAVSNLMNLGDESGKGLYCKYKNFIKMLTKLCFRVNPCTRSGVTNSVISLRMHSFYFMRCLFLITRTDFRSPKFNPYIIGTV